jgi:hypothetical protein
MTTQNPNGPPVQACVAIATAMTAEAKIIKLYTDIKDTITKAVKLLLSILYGTINIADIMGAELVTAIGVAASAIADTVLKSVSGATNALLEAVLSQILEILLAFPDAIYSLVAIPLEKAVEACTNERRYLEKARNDIYAVTSILNRWITNVNGYHFYQQIIDALPYIQKALQLIQQMISELDVTSQNTDSGNAVFDQGKYDQVRNLIRQAIKITQPIPTFAPTQQFTASIVNKLNNQKKEEIAIIENKYRDKRKALDISFTKRIAETNAKANNLKEALVIEKLNLEWAMQIKKLNSDKQLEISTVEASIDFTSLVSVNALQNLGTSIYDSFTSDMNLVGNYLYDFAQNIRDAYTQNISCQTLCATVYNSRDLISRLIKYMIALLRTTGNASAQLAITALEGSEASIATAKTMFEKKVEDYNGNYSGLNKKVQASSSAMATTVSVGNILLQTADATLTGLITDSLVQLINADDVLAADNVNFDAFILRLKKIPDWDQKTDSWVLDITGAVSINPYIQLIADITSTIVLLPVLAISKQPEDQQQLTGMMSNVNHSFNKILVHNGAVLEVITSYIPYQSSACGLLKRLLSRLGLLDTFAISLSVSSVINALITTTAFNKGLMTPNEQNCRDYYPDLFNNLDTISSSYRKDADVLPVAANIECQPSHEAIAEKYPFDKKAYNTTEPDKGIQAEDLQFQESTVAAEGSIRE